MKEWISVYVRLPEVKQRFTMESDNVLVYDGDSMHIATMTADGTFIDPEWHVLQVTHWMPLPESPCK